jgi:hypothetical protein
MNLGIQVGHRQNIVLLQGNVAHRQAAGSKRTVKGRMYRCIVRSQKERNPPRKAPKEYSSRA